MQYNCVFCLVLASDNENVLNLSEESLEALLSNPLIVGPAAAAVIFLILLV